MQPIPYEYQPVPDEDQWGMISTDFNDVSVLFISILEGNFWLTFRSITWECSIPLMEPSVSMIAGACDRPVTSLFLFSYSLDDYFHLRFDSIDFLLRYLVVFPSLNVCIITGDVYFGLA
jgi:hypothetical protein